MLRVMRSQVNNISSFDSIFLLLSVTAVDGWLWLTECAGASNDNEEDAWYVVAEYATDQRSSMDTVEIVEDIWNKAEKFMHQAGSYMQSWYIGKANALYLFKPIMESNVSCIYMCQHDLNVELESELPRPSTSWYSNSRTHMTRTATVCISCMPDPPRLAGWV